MKKKAFTLIELLVIVAIIGVLAAVVIVNLDSAQARSRDARRFSDLNMITKAYQMYYEKNDTYTIAGAGGSSSVSVALCGGSAEVSCGASSGHFNYAPTVASGGYQTTSLNQGLINAGFLVSKVDDPTCPFLANPAYSETFDSETEFCYLIYYADNIKLSAFSHMETYSTSDRTTSLDQSAMNNTDYMEEHFGGNFAVSVIP